MKSRERVQTSLNHQQPDRTPLDYMGTPEADAKLRAHFGSDDMFAIRVALGVDMFGVYPNYVGPKLRRWPDGRYELWGQIFRDVQNEAGSYAESVEWPYAAFQTVADVEAFSWPRTEWFDYSVIPEQCRRYADFGIYCGAGNMDLINGISYGRGVEQTLLDIALEDEVYLACARRRFQFCCENSECILRAAEGRIDIMWIGDDFGTQKGLLMGPDRWRRLFKPYLAKMCALGHKYGARVMLHSCGSTEPLWDEFIEAGVDIYDTVQPEAADMDPAALKRRYGDRICFHGTISTQKTLPHGNADDVCAEVRCRVDTVGRGGGLILAPAHNIQADTPLANILALYETGRSYSPR